MKLLICGDSFSYDHNNLLSWPSLIKQQYTVTNLSQCGCGEYKIYKQLMSKDFNQFDKILICHTSPNRLYINNQYVLHDSDTHQYSDLLFADAEDKKDKSNIAKIAYDYFVSIFDSEYYAHIHNLICADIDNITKQKEVIHVTHFDYSSLYQFDNKLVNCYNIWTQHRGDINHYDVVGNKIIFEKIVDLLEHKGHQ